MSTSSSPTPDHPCATDGHALDNSQCNSLTSSMAPEEEVDAVRRQYLSKRSGDSLESNWSGDTLDMNLSGDHRPTDDDDVDMDVDVEVQWEKNEDCCADRHQASFTATTVTTRDRSSHWDGCIALLTSDEACFYTCVLALLFFVVATVAVAGIVCAQGLCASDPDQP